MPRRVPVTLSFDVGLLKRIDDVAESKRVPRSKLVSDVLGKWLELYRPAIPED